MVPKDENVSMNMREMNPNMTAGFKVLKKYELYRRLV